MTDDPMSSGISMLRVTFVPGSSLVRSAMAWLGDFVPLLQAVVPAHSKVSKPVITKARGGRLIKEG